MTERKKTMLKIAEIKAKDLMQSEVVQLQASAPIEEALSTFEEYRISGAPVVDETGKLLGVLSAFDIAQTEHVREDELETRRGEYYYSNPLEEETGWDQEDDFFSKDDYSPEVLGRERVGDWMNPKIISISMDADLKKVCTIMVKEGVHRVLVVEEDALRGIISSFDVVRYLAENL